MIFYIFYNELLSYNYTFMRETLKNLHIYKNLTPAELKAYHKNQIWI